MCGALASPLAAAACLLRVACGAHGADAPEIKSLKGAEAALDLDKGEKQIAADEPGDASEAEQTPSFVAKVIDNRGNLREDVHLRSLNSHVFFISPWHNTSKMGLRTAVYTPMVCYSQPPVQSSLRAYQPRRSF